MVLFPTNRAPPPLSFLLAPFEPLVGLNHLLFNEIYSPQTPLAVLSGFEPELDPDLEKVLLSDILLVHYLDDFLQVCHAKELVLECCECT